METVHGIALGVSRVNVKVTVTKKRKTVETEYLKLQLTHCNTTWYVERVYHEIAREGHGFCY